MPGNSFGIHEHLDFHLTRPLCLWRPKNFSSNKQKISVSTKAKSQYFSSKSSGYPEGGHTKKYLESSTFHL